MTKDDTAHRANAEQLAILCLCLIENPGDEHNYLEVVKLAEDILKEHLQLSTIVSGKVYTIASGKVYTYRNKDFL